MNRLIRTSRIRRVIALLARISAIIIRCYQAKSTISLRFCTLYRVIARGMLAYTTKTIAKTKVTSRVLAVVVAIFVPVFGYIYLYTPTLAPVANAVTNNTINFQARLLTNTGALIPDGNYHIEFKIYDSASAGSSAQGVCSGNSSTDDCWWRETRTTGNLVTVKNGYITANLGSVTAFPASMPWDQELWLSMNIGGNGGSASWDGEMSPRMKITAVPYAQSASKLKGSNGLYDADQLVQLAPTNTQSVNSTNTAIRINQTGTGSLLDIQSSGNNRLTLSATGNMVVGGTGIFQGSGVTIGTSSQSGVLILSDGSSNTTSVQSASTASNLMFTLPGAYGANGECLVGNGAGGLSFSNTCGSGGSGTAPASAQYLTLASDPNLTNERIAVSGSNITLSDGGANGNLTIGVVSSPIFSGTLTVQGASVTIGTNSQLGSLVLNDGSNNTTTLQSAAIAGNLSFTLPSGYGSSGNCLVSDGAGGLSFSSTCGSGGSSTAPVGASYLTLGLDGTLTNERVLTAGSNISISDGGANGNLTVGLTNTSLTVTAGTGLTGGGSVALGSSTTLNLANTSVSANSYGSASSVATFTVDAQGRLTAAASTPIAINGNQITSGSVAIANGGTGATNSQAAINALSQLTTEGDILFRNATNSTRLARGTNGQCLTSSPTTIAWSDCNAAGSGNYIQNTTANQNTANFNMQSAATTSVTAKFRAIASQTADIIQIRDSADATTVFSVAASGNTTINGALSVGGTSVEREFSTSFPNGIANQKLDLYFPGWFWGNIEVALNSTFSNQNASGAVTKKFYLGLSDTGTVYTNTSRYTDVSGVAPDNFAISDVTWDATNSRWRIQLVHRTSTGNPLFINVKANTGDAGSADKIRNNMGISAVYTTDTTAFSKPTLSFTDNVSIGGSDAGSYRLFVQGGSTAYSNGGQGFTLLTGSNSSSYNADLSVNDDGVNLSNNSVSRGFNLKNINGTLLSVSSVGNVASLGTLQGTRLVSTVAIGTAPLTVTSNTKVNNLNTDLLDGLDSTAFAPASGSSNYVQNQNAGQQATSNFWISGSGRADTSFLAPAVDVATAGTLSVGTSTATAISVGKSGVTTTITGGLTQTTGAVSLTGNAASSLTTSAGALTLTSAAAATWSTTAGNLTLNAGGANNLLLQTNGTTRFTVDTAASTLTGNGATSILGGSTLNLGSTGANALTLATAGSTRFTVDTAASTLTGSGATSLIGGSTLNLGTTGANNLTLATNGTTRLTVTSGGDVNVANNLQIGGTTTITSGRLVRAADGAAGGTAYGFTGSTNMGMYRIDGNNLGFSVGGTDRLRVTTTGASVIGDLSVSGEITQGGYLTLDNDNLVYNGDFETNTTAGWLGISSIVSGGNSGNYAAQSVNAGTIESEDYIPVDPTKDTLQLEGYFKETVTGSTPGILYFGYIAYNASKVAISTAPCGSWCYFAASAYNIPNDGNWHKFNATTSGEGTVFPNFPVGTKYVRVIILTNYASVGGETTLVDHISIKKINNGPMYIGGDFTSTNQVNNNQLSKLYTDSSNNLNVQTTAGNGNIAVTPNGSGNVNLTVAATSLVNVLTGNLKVGNGTPGLTLNGEDAYIEGTLEVDGNIDFGGTLAVTGASTFSSTINSNTFTSTALTFAGANPNISASTAATNISLNAGTTGQVQIGGSSTGDILLGGGSASTGCTVINASGNLACSGTLTLGADVDLYRGTANRLDLATGDSLNIVSGTLQVAGSSGSSGQCLVSQGASAPQWASCNGGSSAAGWTDNGAVIQTSTLTDDVALGTATSSGKLTVQGDSDEVQLFVKGNGTQTANIVNIQNSASSNLLTLSNSGVLTVSTVDATTINTGGTSRITNTGILQNVTYQGNTIAVGYGGTGATTIGSAGSIAYSDGTNYAFTGAGTADQCLAWPAAGTIPVWADCGDGTGAQTGLQRSYNRNNQITTTTARNIYFLLADTATDSNFVVRTATGSTSKSLFVRDNGAGSANGEIVLIDNEDTNLTVTDGLKVTVSGAGTGAITDGIDVSDTRIVNAINIGDNVISGASGVIDFNNFDVLGTGATTINSTLNVVSALNLGNTTTVGSLTISDGSSHTVSLSFAPSSANQTVTFPADKGGTVCLSSGNCVGVGGSGDILNNGQNGAIIIGSNDANSLTFETNNTNRIQIQSGGLVNILSGSDLAFNGTTRITNAGAATFTDLTLTGSIQGTNALVFEGSSIDANDLTITVTNPTGARSIALPNASGTFAVSASGNIALSTAGEITFTGQLPVSNGGTGINTLTANGVLYGNGTSAVGITSAGLTGQCLIATTGSAPAWGSCAGGVGNGATLQDAYNNSSVQPQITTADNKNLSITLADTTTDSNMIVNIANNSNGKFAIQYNSTDRFAIDVNGATFKGGLANLLRVQNAGGTEDFFNVDSSNRSVRVGHSSADANGTLLILDTKNTAGDPTGLAGAMYYNSSTNKFMCYGTAWAECGAGAVGASGTRRATLAPEFPGAVFTGDGSNNDGSLSSDFCSGSSYRSINTTECNQATDEHNYYSWRSGTSGSADYDIYIRYQVPSDYVKNGASTSLANVKFFAKSPSASEDISMTIYNASGTACGSTTTHDGTSVTNWSEVTYTATGAGCDAIVANDMLTIKITLASGSSTNYARIGEIRFDYTGQ